MNLINNNISPLPFYDSLSLQNHRKDYAFGQIYPLIIKGNVLLPFQIVFPANFTALTGAYLVDFNTGKEVNILDDIKLGGWIVNRYSSLNIVVGQYKGSYPITALTHEGRYYLRLNFTGKNLYSEVFTSVNNVDDYMLLTYSNPYNFELKNGVVDFSNSFKFECYICSQVGKPEYIFEEEATERMGYSFIESQVSKKVYKFTFLAPEYLCDALRIVRLCADKQIISKGQTYDLTSFSIEPEWQEQGDLAAVECEFETDTVIANLGGFAEESTKASSSSYDNSFNKDF